jgi:hypothetical protein
MTMTAPRGYPQPSPNPLLPVASRESARAEVPTSIYAVNPGRVEAYNASRRGYPQDDALPSLPTARRTRARAGFVASVTEPFFREDTP